MVSLNKKKKLKNSHYVPSMLKDKDNKGPKGFAFYTPSLRRLLKKIKLQDWQD